jgi:Uma2 family endonuclease
VRGILPIGYYPIPGSRREQLAPDVLVAFVPLNPDRTSYEVEAEGAPPAFVLEVVAPSSRERDLVIKPERYEVMGVQEYAIFDPTGAVLRPPLQGYHRDGAVGGFVPWESEVDGRLWSDALGAYLTVASGELRLQRQDGSLVPTPEEDRAARERTERELASLRAELERRNNT